MFLALYNKCTPKCSKLTALAVLSSIIFIVIVLFSIPDSPAQAYLIDTMYWLRNINPIYGTMTLTVIYAVSLVFCFPGTPLNLAAGFLFGTWLGSFVTVIGADVGATLAFLLGRTLGREWAQQQIMKNKRFGLVNLAVEKNAWLIIFLVRLSPVFPFGICNYLFGVTKSTFWIYWSATTAGLIPCTMAYTYLGSLMRSLSDIYADGETDTTQRTIIVSVALIVTIGGITVITLITKRSLEKAMKEQEIELRGEERGDNELDMELNELDIELNAPLVDEDVV